MAYAFSMNSFQSRFGWLVIPGTYGAEYLSDLELESICDSLSRTTIVDKHTATCIIHSPSIPVDCVRKQGERGVSQIFSQDTKSPHLNPHTLFPALALQRKDSNQNRCRKALALLISTMTSDHPIRHEPMELDADI